MDQIALMVAEWSFDADRPKAKQEDVLGQA
jgi:hypothetical protein